MKFKILNTARITFESMIVDTFQYLTKTYNQSKVVFTKASPYLQILETIQEIINLNFLYFEDAVTEFNIYTAQRDSSIYGISRLAGHNPKRVDAAKGSVQFQFVPGGQNEVAGSFVNFGKNPVLKCLNNEIFYTILNNRPKRIYTDSTNPLNYPLLQGRFQSQNFTGDGRQLQSFNLQASSGQQIDNQYVQVRVNGNTYKIYDFLYDIPRNGFGCLVKTGIAGGIDVYFGNGNFGNIPPRGSDIEIEYLENIGFNGNIDRNPKEIQFEWEEDMTDSLGNDVNPNEVFRVSLREKILFGTNAENPEFTKLIANRGSTTNVLANPEKYVYYLSKLNWFSFVDAYSTYKDEYLDDDNVIYLFLIPDIRKKLTTDTNYFTTSESNFVLEQQEIDYLKASIRESGQQVMQSELVFVNPIIRRYGLNIILKVFKGYNYNDLRSEIVAQLSDYFLETRRRDIMPKSDIINLLEDIDKIDSVNVEFVSERNEAALRNGFYFNERVQGNTLVKERISLENNEDPRLGLDDFGDIIIGQNELPIIRGGWNDRFGQFYEEFPELNKTSSINVVIAQEIEESLQSRISRQSKEGKDI